MKRTLTQIALVCCCIFGMMAASSLHAQIRLGVKANLGLGWLPQRSDAGTTWQGTGFPGFGGGGWKAYPGLGFEAGGYCSYVLRRRFSLESQLLLFQAQGICRLASLNRGTVTEPDIVHVRSTRTVTGLSLPLAVTLQTYWATLLAGIQGDALLENRAVYRSSAFLDSYSHQVYNPAGPYKSWSLSLRFGLIAPISKRFSIEANYVHGLTNLVADPTLNSTMRLRQITYGLRYRILSSR